MTDVKATPIAIDGVSKTFRPSPGWLRLLVKTPIKQDVIALRGVDMEVEPGEVCALVGPNGAGKTTLFRILVGLTTPTTGTARVLGFDAVEESLQIRRRVGWMPTSDQTLFQRHTCAENLVFHGRVNGLSGVRLDNAIADALDLVGLGDKAETAVVALSAGMKARLQLARALLHRPKLLILDEPTASVDPVASYQLINLILEIVENRELAAIVSSHRLDEIEALSSHVILLHDGRVLYDGELEELRSQIDRPTVRFEFGNADQAKAAALLMEGSPGLEYVDIDESSLVVVSDATVTTGDLIGMIPELSRGVRSIEQTRVPLREVLATAYGLDSVETDE